jgi:hypothetical protein
MQFIERARMSDFVSPGGIQAAARVSLNFRTETLHRHPAQPC